MVHLVGLLVKVEGQMKDAEIQDVKQIVESETPTAQGIKCIALSHNIIEIHIISFKRSACEV